MQVTSAMANKMIKALNDNMAEILVDESSNKKYIETVGYETEIPEYNFKDAQMKLMEITDKICKIKHAINVFNTTTVLPELDMTIDESLVYMSQLNHRLTILEDMKNAPKRIRYRGGDRSLVEYECVNYEIEDVRCEYEHIREEITTVQLALDKVNQTVMFEIDVD